jgi:predicted ester cyclase
MSTEDNKALAHCAYDAINQGNLAAFPDAHFTLEELIVEGDTVVVRQTFRGTHKGLDFQPQTSLVQYVAQRSSNCKETRLGATPTTGI